VFVQLLGSRRAMANAAQPVHLAAVVSVPLQTLIQITVEHAEIFVHRDRPARTERAYALQLGMLLVTGNVARLA